VRRGLVILSFALAAVGCTSGDDLSTSSLVSPTPSSTPSPTAAQTTNAEPPTASEVYRMVAPSLGFVETPLSTGSGIFIGDGLLVTNAHVVWPYRNVDVSFFDGGRGEELEVVGVDWSADLALIDVSSISDLPIPVVPAATDYSSGDRVYLIGFPAEDPSAPEPAITTGIVSRTRTWVDGGLTFIQSDALISGGQSGGALVDASGSIIGITSLEIGEGFALALDAADVASRIVAITNGDDPSGVGERWLEDLAVVDRTRQAAHFLDELVWRFDPSAGDEVVIEVKSQTALSGSVIGPDGFLETTMEGDILAFTAELDGPHFVAVVPDAGFDARVELVTNVDLTLLDDPDHGVPIGVGGLQFGNIDYPGDLDWFAIELEEGDELVISASSPNADMGLYVGPLLDLSGDEARSDSDSGAGVIGADAELRYTAASSGTHIIGVFDETQFGPGAYALRVESPG
jgi:hypothetical protein